MMGTNDTTHQEDGKLVVLHRGTTWQKLRKQTIVYAAAIETILRAEDVQQLSTFVSRLWPADALTLNHIKPHLAKRTIWHAFSSSPNHWDCIYTV